MNRFRFLCRCLLLLLAVCLLVSCGESPTESSTEPSSQSVAGEVSAEETSAEESSESEPIREAYMSYEIPEQYYGAYTDMYTVDVYNQVEITSAATAYNIVYRYADGGFYRTQLVKKRWGVWMLGAMSHTDASGKTVEMSSASTDYEWVLSCGASASSITFRGGNHGDYTLSDWNESDSTKSNDRLLDMTFYDAQTGEKLELETGKTVTANGLRVVIHTNIYEGEYRQENVLINTEKRYLFNGPEVFVQSELYLTKNTYFRTSYTCMFPVAKAYGNYALFGNDDGTEKLVQTPLTGTSNYGNNFSDHNVASAVTLFGEKAPTHRMTVRIYNPEDQFYHSERYTRLWDMNPTQNKLYFSAFSGTTERVAAGTSWTYCSSWSFSYEPDSTLPEQADERLGFSD